MPPGENERTREASTELGHLGRSRATSATYRTLMWLGEHPVSPESNSRPW